MKIARLVLVSFFVLLGFFIGCFIGGGENWMLAGPFGGAIGFAIAHVINRYSSKEP